MLMYAIDLISFAVPPLKLTDSGEKAVNWMTDFQVRHLPLVDAGQLVGVLSEDEVLNFSTPEKTIKANEPDLLPRWVYGNQHLYDVLKLVVDYDLSTIPVVNEKHEYQGLITIENLIKTLANTASVVQPGGVIVLELLPRDYALSEIARLIETENAVILSSFITSAVHKGNMELTLKINKLDLKHIVATLERFGYVVKSTFYESDYIDSLKDSYDSLLSYLNI